MKLLQIKMTLNAEEEVGMKMLHPNCRHFFPVWAGSPWMPMEHNLHNIQREVVQQIESHSDGVTHGRSKSQEH